MARWLAITAWFSVGCTRAEPACQAIENGCADALGRPVTAADACVDLAYNGKDEDCDGADWVDIDGDGVPWMTVSAYERQNEGERWPVGEPSVEDLVLVDCNDFVFDIHPNAPETPDDGVDSDCDGGDGLPER